MDNTWACRVLGDSRLEVLPTITAEKLAPLVPPSMKVTRTVSPDLGIASTLALTADLHRRGVRVVPHLTARGIAGPSELERIIANLMELGIDEVFVIGGDPDRPVGEFESALDLLESLANLPKRPSTIGIGASPEGHPKISDDALMSALLAKQRYASYAIMQISFNPEAMLTWINEATAAGFTLPLYLCLPGTIRFDRLVRIAMRLGIGASLRYLEKQRGLARFVLTGGARYDPWATIGELAESQDAARDRRIGVHWSTCNAVEPTVKWVQEKQRELGCPGNGSA